MKIVGDRRVYTVAEVSEACRRRFEDVPTVWVEAEISNLRQHRRHAYFTLVDVGTGAAWQVRCSMNIDQFGTLGFEPRDGMHVQANGRVEYNPKNVTLTFRVTQMAPAGEGLLRARIDALREKLAVEGLTDPARKRPIPVLPRAVGVVTGANSAAEADLRLNITVRHPGMSIVIVHSQVQGDAAPQQIVRAIGYLDRRPDIDVIVVARGGGPLEDLMAFNSEIVCRAVAASRTPIVSAIGHETDVTVCDLVADLRVSTPTKAAEAVVPERDRLLAELANAARRMAGSVQAHERGARDGLAARERHMVRALGARGRTAEAMLAGLGNRLRPSLTRRVERSESTLADVDRRLGSGIRSLWTRRSDRADALAAALTGPGAALVRRRAGEGETALDERTRRLRVAAMPPIEDRSTRLAHLGEVLELLSPGRTVARGYAIVRDAATGTVRTRRHDIDAGSALDVEMRDGTMRVHVDAEGET